MKNAVLGYTSWESYFLTFRFKNVRVPDEYDSVLNLFLFSEIEAYRTGLQQLVGFREGGDRIEIVLADGVTRYEINRYCPHQGGDLKYATLEGSKLTCPRHRWQFDLQNAGKCTTNDESICAVALAAKRTAKAAS